MSSTGNVLVTVGANVDRGGRTAWSNPGNIVSSNDVRASCNSGTEPTGSDYLVCTAADLSAVPDGATINGITVTVEANEGSAGTEPLLAQLQDADGNLFGSSKSGANEGDISGSTDASYTYGGTADLWGATLTPAIVKDADFGVRLWFANDKTLNVDAVWIAVEYTEVPDFPLHHRRRRRRR